MRNILGDYADVLPPEALVTSKNERHPQELAGLRGKRFVSSSEIDTGQRWSISKINRLTGEEMIRAHFMHQNDIRYKPTLHLWPFTNNKPAIGRGGGGPHTERRLHLIDFGVRFLERAPKNDTEAPVANLKLKEELQAEYPAILRWLIDGNREWAKQRLNPPESMREATKEYLIDQDVLAQWIEERTQPTDNEDMTTKSAFDDWKVWAAEHDEDAGSINQFSRALKEAGLTYDRKANFRGFRKVRLRSREPGTKEE
jgi:putative DNA primase/helicase